ncbi:MAG: ABC transporter permease subunit [Clostridia bacterium]|jgi:NitT/TauT family transport system permease protein|nr:ABC transporter permease subunit [Clostridia bacterium]
MLGTKPSKLHKILKGLAIAVFWIAMWQFAALIVNQPLFVPSPLETVASLGGLIVTSKFWLSVLMTFYRVVFGLVVSLVLGLVFAYISSHFKTVESVLAPFISAIKSTPIMSIIILALVWFQASFVPVFSCILLCFPIFYTNTLSGIKSVDKKYTELAKVYHVKRARILREITLPSVLPHIYAALSICLGFSWKAVVAAEVLSSPKYSMGFNLLTAKQHLETSALFAWTIAIIIISLAVEKGLMRLLPKKGNTL